MSDVRQNTCAYFLWKILHTCGIVTYINSPEKHRIDHIHSQDEHLLRLLLFLDCFSCVYGLSDVTMLHNMVSGVSLSSSEAERSGPRRERGAWHHMKGRENDQAYFCIVYSHGFTALEFAGLGTQWTLVCCVIHCLKMLFLLKWLIYLTSAIIINKCSNPKLNSAPLSSSQLGKQAACWISICKHLNCVYTG